MHQYIVSSDAKAARNLPLMAAVAQAQAGVVEAPLPVAPKAKKEKLTFTGALKFLATQQQIRCLATMAICQGMASNLLEVTWKGECRTGESCESDAKGFGGERFQLSHAVSPRPPNPSDSSVARTEESL